MTYLERLRTLTVQEKSAFLSLGVDSPLSLYFVIRTDRVQFDKMLGALRTDQLLKELRELVSPAELETVKNLEQQSSSPPLGARLTGGPKVMPSSVDLELRDRLFEQWQKLKRINTPEAQEQARKVERQLNDLLDHHAAQAGRNG